ncbi:MAG: hypothetical protein MI784_11770 [Cytophagales bacterium]|nr:hypothetical protein [Cytophagales bacterium]
MTCKYLTNILLAVLLCGVHACQTTNSSCDKKNLTVLEPSKKLDIKQDFIYQILNRKTQRQGGQQVSVFVKYRYDDELLESNTFPDYRKMRAISLHYLQPSADYPASAQWEVLSRAMARELMGKFPIKGISVQWQVFPNEHPKKGSPYEPGFHGSVFTMGNIEPLDLLRSNRK